VKICIVHNEYGKFSGEEAVVINQTDLLKQHGHTVCRFVRSSAELPEIPFGRLRAFWGGIYNPFAKKAFKLFLKKENPDLVHIHNLYPLISPSILEACRESALPVVMTVHNYRLVCPTGLFMSKPHATESVCEKCAGGQEYWCIFRNCEGSYFKSIGYAARTWFARIRRLYLNNVTLYISPSNFQKQKLVSNGYPEGRIRVIPNMSELSVNLGENIGDYVGFVGRVSPEKGISTLISAANKLPTVSFKAAGSYSEMESLASETPDNLAFLGQLDRGQVDDFFKDCRMAVVCSIWYETFGLVLIEAMLNGKPVIASRIGGIPDIVEDGVTGLLFEPGNADDLATKILYLWERPELCRQMGEAGREKALREYSPDKYYQRLLCVYDEAMQVCNSSV